MKVGYLAVLGEGKCELQENYSPTIIIRLFALRLLIHM